MFRKGLYFTFIVYVFSLFLWQNVSHAYPSGKAWETAKTDLTSRYTTLQTYVTHHKETRDAVETLNRGWASNKQKIEDSTNVALDNAGATLVGIVTTALSPGAKAITYAPSIFSGWLTTKAGLGTGNASKNKDEYLSAMSTALAAFDTAFGFEGRSCDW